MTAQLDQILAYLDKPGVTEVVIGNGRPVSFRRNHENVGLTKEPLSKAQLATLIKGTTLYHLVPDRDGTKPAIEISIGSRSVKVAASRRGDEVAFRIEPGTPEIELSPQVQGRAKRATRGVRTTTGPIATGGAERSKRTSIPVATAPVRKGDSEPLGTLDLEPPRGEPARTRGKRTSIPILVDAPRDAGTTTRSEGRAKRHSKTALAPTMLVPPVGEGSPADFDFELGPEIDTAHVQVVMAPAKSTSSIPTSKGFQGMIERAKHKGASDLHIATNRPISLRVLGELVPLDPSGTPISAAEAEALLKPLLRPEHEAQLASVGYVDLALEAPGGGRLRTNISKFQGGLKGTFRIARTAPATLDELGLPKDLAKLVHHHQGLVVVAGPSGHGKTTTLSALVDLINASRPFHIITVEDPIEIVYPRKSAVVSQREVGPHTKSFAAALKGSLREDPDVIVIGELRDRETVEIALTAAETGHLVIATMSTPNAAKTIDRLVDMFPPEDQAQVRASIAGALRAIVAQRLLPSAQGDRVHAAVEVLTGVLALAAMIREDKLFQLPNLMQRGKAFGMIRFDDSLLELARAGKITAETALATSDNKKELAVQLKGGAAPPGAKPPEATPAKKGGLASIFGRKES